MLSLQASRGISMFRKKGEHFRSKSEQSGKGGWEHLRVEVLVGRAAPREQIRGHDALGDATEARSILHGPRRRIRPSSLPPSEASNDSMDSRLAISAYSFLWSKSPLFR